MVESRVKKRVIMVIKHMWVIIQFKVKLKLGFKLQVKQFSFILQVKRLTILIVLVDEQCFFIQLGIQLFPIFFLLERIQYIYLRKLKEYIQFSVQ